MSAPSAFADQRPAILFLGDSLTAGHDIPVAAAYPTLIQARLDAAGYPYRVINAGVSGDTTENGRARTDWLLEEPRIAIMVLALGANDMLRGLPVNALEKNLAAIIQKAQKKDIVVLLVGMRAFYNMGKTYVRRFEQTYPRLRDRFGTAYIPFLLEGVALDPQYNLPDGLHPNPAGHRLMAETIWKGLQPLLEKLKP